MLNLAQRALDIATSLGASYGDVRHVAEQSRLLSAKNEEVALNSGSSEGMGIRLICDGAWGFAATQDLTDEGILLATRRAVETAKASAICMDKPIELAAEPSYETEWMSPYDVDPFSISIEAQFAYLTECNAIMRKVKGTTLAESSMTFIKTNKLFVSTEGSRIRQQFLRSSCGIVAYASNDKDRQQRSYPNSFGGQHALAGWELIDRIWKPKDQAQRCAEEAVALLKAPACPQGTSDIILSGNQLGLQIHESTGHPSELDRALLDEINFAGASFLTPDNLGKLKYGSKIVNLVADATEPGALGSFGYDDDGVKAQRVNLVKNGTFCGYLSSRDRAKLIKLNRSGGMMRAESWVFAPIIRMTNISLLPGKEPLSLNELIADTKDGILMDTNHSWSIDQMRYNFQFSTEIGWEIKNGKRKRMLKNCSYGGITPKFWRSCDAICSSEEYVNWGVPNCGKGQPQQTMWTGHGAAPARFRKISVGMAHAE